MVTFTIGLAFRNEQTTSLATSSWFSICLAWISSSSCFGNPSTTSVQLGISGSTMQTTMSLTCQRHWNQIFPVKTVLCIFKTGNNWWEPLGSEHLHTAEWLTSQESHPAKPVCWERLARKRTLKKCLRLGYREGKAANDCSGKLIMPYTRGKARCL